MIKLLYALSILLSGVGGVTMLVITCTFLIFVTGRDRRGNPIVSLEKSHPRFWNAMNWVMTVALAAVVIGVPLGLITWVVEKAINVLHT